MKPSQIHILEAHNFIKMPWKNGLGHTVELTKHVDSQATRYRLSRATIGASGAFSLFPDLERTMVLLSEGHVRLDLKGTQESLELTQRYDSISYSGATPVQARLNSKAVEVLNIMVRQQDTRAKINTFYASSRLEMSSMGQQESFLAGYFYAHQDSLLVEGEKQIEVKNGALAHFKEPFHAVLKKGLGTLILITDHRL
ncbi:HutD/Ves family protein [Marinomonas epiphytica]